MQNRWLVLFTIALGGLSSNACTTPVTQISDLEAAGDAATAYHAYKAGDCVAVHGLTDEYFLRTWEFNEMRHSMQLLRAFCDELDGDTRAATDTYRHLIIDAPSSFAAMDAEERLRILRLSEENSESLRLARSARDRIDPTQARRTPIDRVPVQFPPLARATGIDGFVVVEFGVTRNGKTENPIVVDSNPPLLFDGASVRAIRRWQFMREPEVNPNHRQLIRLLFQRGEGAFSVEQESASDAY